MKFPDKLTVVARDRDTRMSVEGVAIVLVLFAQEKNNYSVGPLISNRNGEVHFTREECEFAIKKAREMFVMDYYGDLESCRPMIEVSLHPAERIEKMRQQYEELPTFWGRAFHNADRLFAELREVSNAKYEPARITAAESQLETNHARLELPLIKRAT